MDEVKLTGYIPGAIGRITELHGAYYSEHWNFNLFFESKIATELSEFLNRFDRTHDGFWVARLDERIVGSVAIDGKEALTNGARLRWLIVDPRFQGRGIGNRLLGRAVDFCRNANFKRVYLFTFVGLDPARHLYEKFGFVLCEELEDNQWGRTLTEQVFELFL